MDNGGCLPNDARKATVRWQPSKGAEFYVVRIGTLPDLLTQPFQVYDGATSTQIDMLNTGQPYYVAADAVNQSGIRRGGKTVHVK